MNYQLAHTNILLSGQTKWDLVLDRQNGELEVSDFHLTPISPNIPYNKYNDESLLNYDHQDNLRCFFEKIEGNFWQTMEDPSLKHSWPIIRDTPSDTHCGLFEMGCRRTRYQLYGKQFEFLCPVWLEELNSNYSLQFHISVGAASKFDSSTGKWKDFTKYASRTLDLRVGISDFHNRFVKYFNNYLEYTGINEGANKVMEINLAAKTAWLTGIEISSGNVVTKSTNNLCSNLLYRERPMMEFDSFLINSFKENKMITKQLFNFCLHFNLEDILDQELLELAKGQSVSIECTTSIQKTDDTGDPEYLEIRDFYSNYEYIPRQQIGLMAIDELANIAEINSGDKISGRVTEYTGEIPNVLTYLGDNKYVQFIDKNKLVPNIIHWSLQDNPDYIFNLYNGFGGFVDRNGTPISKSYIYGDAPDLLKSYNSSVKNEAGTSTLEPSNIGWCNMINCTWDTLKHLLTMGGSSNWKDETGDNLPETEAPNYIIYKYASDFTKTWTKYVKYSKTVQDIAGESQIFSTKVILIKLPDDVDIAQMQQQNPIVRLKYLSGSKQDTEWTLSGGPTGSDFDSLYWASDPNGINLIYLISNNFNSFTFRHVIQTLNNQIMPDKWRKDFETENEYNDWLQSGVQNNYFWGTLMPELREMMRSVISPPLVSFTGSLDPFIADSPSLSTNEIDYYKNDQADPSKCFVLRYDGHITPTFIPITSEKNYLYYKDQISDNRSNGLSQLQSSIWAQYVRTGYSPVYPSIKYCAIKSATLDYEHPCLIDISLLTEKIPICQDMEYSWFNNGSSLILLPSLSFKVYTKFKSDGITPMSIDELVKEWLTNYYGIQTTELLDYIWKLYNMKSSFEYDYNGVTKEDPQWFLNHYVYSIEMTLK